MSDVGRYRKVFPRIWQHSGFREMPESSQRLALYLITGPQTNRIGLFRFSVGMASEDLGVTKETIRKGLANVATTFAWLFDDDAGVVYIPSWWRWNEPANRNVLQGNLKDLSDVPSSMLTEAFSQNIKWLPDTSHETFIHGCQIRLPEHHSTQKQYQKHFQNQKQEHEPKNDGKATKRAGIDDLTPLRDLAAQVITQHSGNTNVDYLIEALKDAANQKTGNKIKKSDALIVINEALSQRRTA